MSNLKASMDGRVARRRDLLVGWICFGLAGALAWFLSIRQATDMQMSEALTLGTFTSMWVLMMAAMMFPSVAPVALMWGRSIRSSSSGPARAARSSLFALGYLAVWSAIGFLAYAGSAGIARLAMSFPHQSRWFGAGLFLVSGIYQLTPLKDACLRHCRSPMSQLISYAALKGPWRDLRVGVHHGLYCVGCCWGIMLVLLAVGTMNLLVAAGLAVVIFVEKISPKGPLVARGFGVLLLALAIAVPFFPMVAPTLARMH